MYDMKASSVPRCVPGLREEMFGGTELREFGK